MAVYCWGNSALGEFSDNDEANVSTFWVFKSASNNTESADFGAA